jgi:hypothetical protein
MTDSREPTRDAAATLRASKKRRRLAIALTVIVLVVVVMFNGNRVTGTVGGRVVSGVSAHLLSLAKFSSDGTTTTIQLGSKTATVAAETVVLSDGASLPIPAACKQVDVQATCDGMRVLFDGVRAN